MCIVPARSLSSLAAEKLETPNEIKVFRQLEPNRDKIFKLPKQPLARGPKFRPRQQNLDIEHIRNQLQIFIFIKIVMAKIL